MGRNKKHFESKAKQLNGLVVIGITLVLFISLLNIAVKLNNRYNNSELK